MTLSFFQLFFVLVLVAEFGILLYKIYQVTQEFNKLYNFFIRSSKNSDDKVSFSSFMKGLPPTNGECPTKEELDNFKL